MLYVTGVAAPEPRAITDGTQSIGYPAWSPDERLHCRRDQGRQLDARRHHRPARPARSGSLPTKGTDLGAQLVAGRKKIAAATLREGVWSLQWIDATSGEAGEIAAAGPPHVYLRYPDWSPRGTAVVFERGELRGNIWMLPIP